MKNLNLCLGLFVCLIGIENSYGFLQNYRGKLYMYEYINIYGVEYLLNVYMKIKNNNKKETFNRAILFSPCQCSYTQQKQERIQYKFTIFQDETNR